MFFIIFFESVFKIKYLHTDRSDSRGGGEKNKNGEGCLARNTYIHLETRSCSTRYLCTTPLRRSGATAIISPSVPSFTRTVLLLLLFFLFYIVFTRSFRRLLRAHNATRRGHERQNGAVRTYDDDDDDNDNKNNNNKQITV